VQRGLRLEKERRKQRQTEERSRDRKTDRQTEREKDRGERARREDQHQRGKLAKTDEFRGSWVRSDALDRRFSDRIAVIALRRLVTGTAVANEYISFYSSCAERRK
jgi:hypothetical protein